MQRLVLIAADPGTVRTVQLALRSAGGFSVVASVDGRSAARSTLAEHRPDVVIVDDMCQRANAMARVRESATVVPEALVVLLTSGLEDGWLDEAFAAGADAAVGRRLAPAVLGPVLREVARGTVVHNPRRRRSSIGAPQASGLELTAHTARTSA